MPAFFGILASAAGLGRLSGARQVPNEEHDLPDVVVAEGFPPAGHAGGTDAVLNDPFKLAVFEFLHFRRIQGRHWRRHLVSKDHAAVKTIGPVATAAIILKLLPAFVDVGSTGGKRIAVFRSTYGDSLLHLRGDIRFELSGRSRSATGERGEEQSRKCHASAAVSARHFACLAVAHSLTPRR